MVPFRPRPAHPARPIRRRLPRRALPWWAATLALAAATGLVADGVLQRAGDAEARWGTTRSVLVATGPIEPGAPSPAGPSPAGSRPRPCPPPRSTPRRPAVPSRSTPSARARS